MFERETGSCPLSRFPLSKARLSILSWPILAGKVPESWLFLRSKCINRFKLTIDRGIGPERLLSAKLRTVRSLNWPISAGIRPEIRFPTRSRTRRRGSEAMQLGIEPEMPFQSASMRPLSRSRWQMAGEIEPVMNPVRWAFWKMGSSDSPRRLISATRCVRGSQTTPYQRLQQFGPVQELNTPKWGSVRADLMERSAARSDGGQALTAVVMASSRTATMQYPPLPISLSLLLCFVGIWVSRSVEMK